MRSKLPLLPLLAVTVPLGVLANPLGITGVSGIDPNVTCRGCHVGTGTATVTITGPSSVAANSTSNYTLTISGGPGTASGMNVAVDIPDATLGAGTGSTRSVGDGELYHTNPRAFSGGSVSYPFTLVAPAFSGPVKIYASGLSTNGSGTGGDSLGNAVLTVNVTGGSTAPRLSQPAKATPATTLSNTTTLSVLGVDDGPESALTYTWSAANGAPAPVTFSPNGTNAAKNTTATFSKAGSYTLAVRITDANNESANATVPVTVTQELTYVVLQPDSAEVAPHGTYQFNAVAQDQFKGTIVPAPTFTWMVTGGGTISSTGLFTASPYAGGPHAVSARTGNKTGGGSVTIKVGAPSSGGGGGGSGSGSDTVPPTVSMQGLSEAQRVSGKVMLTAEATDDVGVANVSYAVDGTTVGVARASPWAFELDTTRIPNGPHTIEVAARDGVNNVGKGVAVTVMVQNAGNGPDELISGCQSIPMGAAWWLLGLLPLAGLRRRR